MGRRRIGLAIGHDGVWAVPIGEPPDRTITSRNAFRRTSEIAGGSVREATKAIVNDLEARGGSAHITFLPPLAQLRQIDLPDSNGDDLSQYLTTEAERFFFGAREPQLVAGVRARSANGSGETRANAEAVPIAVVNDVLDALTAERVDVVSVSCAYDAWCAEISENVHGTGGATSWVVVCLGNEIEIIRCMHGAPLFVRRTPRSDDDPTRLAKVLMSEFNSTSSSTSSSRETGVGIKRKPVVVLGPKEGMDIVKRAVVAAGAEPISSDSEDAFLAPAFLAARGAAKVPSGIELIPEKVKEQRRHRGKRLGIVLGAAAAAVLALSAGFELWGAWRELASVSERRAELAPEVQRVTVERDMLMDFTGRIRTLATIRQTTQQWSRIVSDVARQLPTDAYLVTLRGGADSLFLEGFAANPGDVFAAVQNTAGIATVRAQTPVQTGAATTGDTREPFSLVARRVTIESVDSQR